VNHALLSLLRQPPIGYGEINTAYVHRVFLLRQPMTAVQAFLKGHLPAGMRSLGSGQLTQSGGIGMESVSYRITFVPASGRAPRVVVTPRGA
jgi:hypothetical protein